MKENLDEKLTVSELYDLCKKLVENGYGNMTIKCMDAELHRDEITLNYIGEGYMHLRGYLFHNDLAKRISAFQNDFKKATDKFYGYVD